MTDAFFEQVCRMFGRGSKPGGQLRACWIAGLLLLAGCTASNRSVAPEAAPSNLGFHLDERGVYRYRQAFAVEADGKEIFERARIWLERSHRGVNDAVLSVDTARRQIDARGAFTERASDVSDYVFYELHIEVRNGWYGVTYDNFVFQPAPTHHRRTFEVRLPEREAIYKKTVAYINEALEDLARAMPAPLNGPPLRIDSARFRLVGTPESFELRDLDGARLSIGSPWLEPPNEPDAEPIVVSDRFDETVHAFPIGDGFTGLHLSSYEIQNQGSAQAAAGRDVFLILLESDGRLSDGQMLLGISKLRGRSIGCWNAVMHRFLLGDVNDDGLTDIGVVREEVNCVGADLLTSEPRGYPVKWHVFTGFDWEFRPEYDDALPAGVFVLPLLGIERSPMDFVRSIEDRR